MEKSDFESVLAEARASMERDDLGAALDKLGIRSAPSFNVERARAAKTVYEKRGSVSEAASATGMSKTGVLSSMNSLRRYDQKMREVGRFTLDTPIRDLPLDVRILNCLANENVTCLRDARNWSDEYMRRIPNFGKTSQARLKAAILEAAERASK